MTEISAKSPPEKLPTKLPNVCRVCLTDTGSLEGDFYEIADIYLGKNDDSASMLALSAVLSLFIEDELKGGELLPTTICKSCADKAQAAYKFIDQCRQTDKAIKNRRRPSRVRRTKTSLGFQFQNLNRKSRMISIS
ncbi:uncharacterized zinc finger protein CG2678-like [Anopheles aquasalis]|uniref:uncharacterized zinc finger protein CG2678-like n=1 Tax=Anopheles aquasalis TaxID=42839 RepID=UPI00215A0F06|nr:uncharacterized zinc finger protein CG2678-like [Anopheles aquasalis]